MSDDIGAAPGALPSLQEANAATCKALAALKCGESDPSAAEVEAACLGMVSGQSKEWVSRGCKNDDMVSAIVCMRRSLACHEETGAEREFSSAAEAALFDAWKACSGGLVGTGKCIPANEGAVALDCRPIGEPGVVPSVDLDGDGAPDSLPEDVEDRRVECTSDPNSNYLVVNMPPILVDGGTETFSCMFGTWEGPDTAIVSSAFGTDQASNHHVLVLTVPDGEYEEIEDGKVFDCYTLPHIPGGPIFHGMANPDHKTGTLLRAGQRYYIERHTLNASPHPILVNVYYAFALAPVASIEILASWYLFGPLALVVPPGIQHIKSSCTWPEDTSVLLVAPHMHERGLRFAVDWTSAEGTERILEVDPWREEYVSSEFIEVIFPVGEFQVHAGDVFTTHCTWDNDTGEALKDPQEMCNVYGVATMDHALECYSPYEFVDP